MRQNFPINRAGVDKILGHGKPLSSMTHEVRTAAVAAELHLGIDDLEVHVATTSKSPPRRFSWRGSGPSGSHPSRAVELQRAADAIPGVRRA